MREAGRVMMTEAETESLQLLPKEHPALQGRLLPYRLQRDHGPATTLISDVEPPEP